MIAKLNEEKKLHSRGYKRIACLDEAGRGPLAGPVVAGAVIFNGKKIISGIKDSKQLSEKQREEFYKILTTDSSVEWGIGIVSEKVIDKINILEAAKLAMKKALTVLKKPDFILSDGNMKIDYPAPQRSVVKGDAKVFSCAAASILAKVTRDRIMERYSKKYPEYGFDIHKGYPTKHHLKMIKKYGICKIHRKSFSPVRDEIKKRH